jgi:hypothetical protein
MHIGWANRKIYQANDKPYLLDLCLTAGLFSLAFLMQRIITKDNDGPVNRGSQPQKQPSFLV